MTKPNRQGQTRASLLGLFCLVIGGLFLWKYQPWLQATNPARTLVRSQPIPQPAMIRYQQIVLEKSLVHVVKIPASESLIISPIIAPTNLQKVETLVQERNGSSDSTAKVIAAINGGFFDPNNQQTTSYIIKDGKVLLDPSENTRLVDNPDLSTYMLKILNRSEFRRYQCEAGDKSTIRYAIALRNESPPANCQTIEALGAGPALLPQDRGEEEAFIDDSVNRDALGSQYPNARSAVGITAEGEVIFVMAAQVSDIDGPSGLTLPELAKVMQSLDIEEGLNLDGGSSSSLYYQGEIHYGRLDSQQSRIERPVKSILAVLSKQ